VFFINNIFLKNNDTLFTDHNEKAVFKNNIFFGNAYLGYDNPSGFITLNPQLTENKNHTYSISKNSPAIDNALEINPMQLDNTETDDDWSISLDIEGQKRDAKKDIGCDEYSSTVSMHTLLNKNNVGPSYISH